MRNPAPFMPFPKPQPPASASLLRTIFLSLLSFALLCAACNPSTYDLSDFIRQLRDQDLQVKKTGEEVNHGFIVNGTRLEVNRENLYVYVFPDAAAASAAAAFVSPDGFAIYTWYGTPSATGQGSTFLEIRQSWAGKPHFYRTDRLIVIYVGDNPDLLKALETLCGKPFAGEGRE